MKFYIEIETTSDKLCLFALDNVLRAISKATLGFDHIADQDRASRIVLCQERATDRFGGVVTATLTNKMANT